MSPPFNEGVAFFTAPAMTDCLKSEDEERRPLVPRSFPREISVDTPLCHACQPTALPSRVAWREYAVILRKYLQWKQRSLPASLE